MRKLSLKLDELEVETFETSAAGLTRGTVVARVTEPETCDYPCPSAQRTWCGTCDPAAFSCAITCPQSCYGSCGNTCFSCPTCGQVTCDGPQCEDPE
jgi:hypothetical protein